MASNTVRNVGIVGAGAMGRGIAQVCAAAGCAVLLFDTAPDSVARARSAIQDDLRIAVSKGRLALEDADATLARVTAATGLQDLAGCELVVEAIIERLDIKQQLFADLESIVQPDCILATNTSSLSVTAIAAACKRPNRVAGWHFFNPVTRMRLVEVIQAPRTGSAPIEALVSLSGRIGHRAIVTTDSPGFVVNHAGRAFVTEGLKLLTERAANHEALDAILRECAGFRMGPFELLDLTGLDVSVPVMESIHAQYYGDDRYRPAALGRTRMMAGLLGRKVGQGFYQYGAKEPEPPTVQAPTLADPDATWWQVGGAALPDVVTSLLTSARRAKGAADAQVILVAPLDTDLSTAIGHLRVDPAKVVAVDSMFASLSGVTLMTCPATTAASVAAAQAVFAVQSVPTFVIADSPGYVAPRVVSCLINLACEMAQQGIASPDDIDIAVRLGLGYPLGPFEWGDKLSPRRVLHVMQGLYSTFGDQRYRPAPWLVRRAQLGLSLSAPDRQL